MAHRGFRDMRWSRLLAVLVVLLAVASAAAPTPGAMAAAAGKRYYVSRRPRLKVELTIYRGHVHRVAVSAIGVCSNGQAADQLGFGIVGGPGLAIRGRARRFNRTVSGTRRNMIFRGRVEGDKVVGLFRQMYREEPREEGDAERLPGPWCGSGSSPRGEVIHFVARWVGAKDVPPSLR